MMNNMSSGLAYCTVILRLYIVGCWNVDELWDGWGFVQIGRIRNDRPPNRSVKHFSYPVVQDMSNGDNDNDYGDDEDKNKIPTWIFSQDVAWLTTLCNYPPIMKVKTWSLLLLTCPRASHPRIWGSTGVVLLSAGELSASHTAALPQGKESPLAVDFRDGLYIWKRNHGSLAVQPISC